MQTGRVNNQKIAIVGGGTLASSVALGLRHRGIESVTLSNLSGPLPSFLGVIEATGGMAPAFDCALTALGRGLPLISASPLLAGVHGEVLLTAARAQHAGLGLSGALLGATPLPAEGDELVLLTAGAGAEAVARIADRGQPFDIAAKNIGHDTADHMSDLGGKLTLCRALAMHGLWSGHKWLNPGAVKRTDVAALTPERAADIRRAGYAWRFGAIIKPESIYVGPLALGASDALAQSPVSGLTLFNGSATLHLHQSEAERALAGILHDTRLLMANQLHAPLKNSAKTSTESAVTDWLPLTDDIAIPALGQAAFASLRVAA